jgi:hypothetical protein
MQRLLMSRALKTLGELSTKRSLSKKSVKHIARKASSDLNYAFSDQLLEETQFSDIKHSVTKKKQPCFSS